MVFPWPIKDGEVEELHCSHVLEHIPGLERGKFMDEVYRVMAVGAKATFIVPAYNSSRAVQDFTHVFPPVCADSFWYFNKAWREVNKLTHGHYALKCDFDHQVTGTIGGGWAQRAYDAQVFASTHYMNVTQDIHAALIKRAPA
jgi:hypothetical protein